MTTIAKLTVTKSKQVDSANWATVRDVTGPREIPSSFPKGACVVQATTLPHNNPAEWKQISWKGGKPVSGHPNQRLLERAQSGKAIVEASIGAHKKQLTLWIIWADVKVLTKGPRPAPAVSWSKGVLFPGPDRCGAFEVGSFTMGKNARGQVVAVAEISPSGIGKLLKQAKKHNIWKLRRQLTAHDFADGNRAKHKKSFVTWVGDDSPAGMMMLNPATNDKLYDTDAPDLPTALKTAQTYNNFRQWAEWDGIPCSNYVYWYFKARWKQQKVTMKEVGQGSIPSLPNKPLP